MGTERSKTLEKVSRERILRNARIYMREKYANAPLWAFVSDVTAYGSTSSMEICMELGWNPHAVGSDDLPAHPFANVRHKDF